MTGAPQSTLQVPLYKICCLIPYQVNEQDIVYLSSVSEINRFLQVHGLGNKFGVDSARSSVATCTEEVIVLPETKKIIINNDVGKIPKETNDFQIQYNCKNVSSSTGYGNEIIPWHKCSKNESVVHFCKKCSSNLCEYTNNCSTSENNKKETLEAKHKYSVVEANGHITADALSDSSSLKKVIQKSRSDTKNKKTYSLTNRSFIKLLKKRNKSSRISVNKSKKDVDMKEQFTDMCDKTIDTKITLLPESVVCETSTEISTTGLVDANQKNVILNEIKREEPPVASANTRAKSPNTLSKHGDYDLELKEVISSREWSDLSDQSSTLDCGREDQNNQKVDLSFYESPSKFVENMSECVMRRFIGEECDDSWLKLYEGKKIPKKYLGIDKDLSELYVLKKMVKHEATTCLLSQLTPRQKRQLAKGIVDTLEEFKINGSRWGGLSREILNNVCKLFRIQQGLVSENISMN